MKKVLALDYDRCGTQIALWHLVLVPFCKKRGLDISPSSLDNLSDDDIAEISDETKKLGITWLEKQENAKPIALFRTIIKRAEAQVHHIETMRFTHLVTYSMRQTHHRDDYSAEETSFGYCLRVFPQLAEALGLKFEPVLMPDIVRGARPGTEFSSSKSPSDYGFDRDHQKLTHTYGFLVHFGLSSSEPMELHFVDDKREIIEANHQLLRSRPELIPCNVSPKFALFCPRGQVETLELELPARQAKLPIALDSVKDALDALGLNRDALNDPVAHQYQSRQTLRQQSGFSPILMFASALTYYLTMPAVITSECRGDIEDNTKTTKRIRLTT